MTANVHCCGCGCEITGREVRIHKFGPEWVHDDLTCLARYIGMRYTAGHGATLADLESADDEERQERAWENGSGDWRRG